MEDKRVRRNADSVMDEVLMMFESAERYTFKQINDVVQQPDVCSAVVVVMDRNS